MTKSIPQQYARKFKLNKLDVFLPQYDFSEKHEMIVESTILRVLFRLRGLKSNNFQMIKDLFSILYDEPSKEILLGTIGQPWNWRKDLLKFSKEYFLRFNEPNYAKIVWNFNFQEQGKKTLVSTETRILCTDEASRKKFRAYWFFIRPLSGLVRIELLKLIRKSLDH
jgi:hypothetical protein